MRRFWWQFSKCCSAPNATPRVLKLSFRYRWCNSLIQGCYFFLSVFNSSWCSINMIGKHKPYAVIPSCS